MLFFLLSGEFLCFERWGYMILDGGWCLEGVLGCLLLVLMVLFFEIDVGNFQGICFFCFPRS